MRVGVTGGAGFIGSHVIDQLIACGHEPIVFDPRGRRPHIEVECRLGDVRDATSVFELAAHVDGIIHLAAVLGTQETITNPGPAAQTNLVGGLNVLAACHQYDLAMVNICVGNWWMDNSYSITKHAFERMVRMYVREHAARVCNVRVVNAYGPRQAAAPPFAPGKVRKIIPAFVCRALCGMPVEVYGDGRQVSDCVHVSDVARVLVAALETVAVSGGFVDPVEVGPAEHHTVNDVARLVIDAAGSTSPVVHLPMRPGEEPGAKVTADASTLAKVGLDPAGLVPLPEGIADTVEWFRGMRGVTWRHP